METAHEKITVFSEFISTKLLPGYHLFCCVLWLEGKPKTLGQAQHQWGVQVRVCSLLGEAAGFVLMRFCFCWQNTFLSFREELLIITTKRIIRLKIRKDQERKTRTFPQANPQKLAAGGIERPASHAGDQSVVSKLSFIVNDAELFPQFSSFLVILSSP